MNFPFGLELFDARGFVLRQHLGKDPLDPDLFRDCFGCPFGVTGHHDRFDAQFFEIGDRLGGVWTDDVGRRDDAGGFAVHDDQNHRLALADQPVDGLSHRPERHVETLSSAARQPEPADRHRGADAVTGDVLEVLECGIVGYATPFELIQHCLS